MINKRKWTYEDQAIMRSMSTHMTQRMIAVHFLTNQTTVHKILHDRVRLWRESDILPESMLLGDMREVAHTGVLAEARDGSLYLVGASGAAYCISVPKVRLPTDPRRAERAGQCGPRRNVGVSGVHQ